MDNSTKEDLMIALAVSLGALFFATVLTLLTAKYYKQIRLWLSEHLPWLNKDVEQDMTIKQEEQKKDSKGSKTVGKKQSKAMLIRSSRLSSGSTTDASFLPVFVLNKETEFTIPGSTQYQVQPILKEEPDVKFKDVELGSTPPSSGSSSPGTTHRKSVTLNVPNANLNTQRLLRTHSLESFSEDSPTSMQRVVEQAMDDNRLRPELYLANRRRTCGLGNLGKIRFSLQFTDKSKKKLDLFLHRLDKLQFIRPEITAVYVNVILLPERETIYHTKEQDRMPSLVFDEKFVFHSKPLNRDFEAKTIRFVVIYMDKSSKEFPYGEARMPLLSREIYSQVQTDVSLNMKPFSQTTESGDLLVQLAYTPDSGTLSIMLKTMKFPSSSHSENMTGIQIKSYVKRQGESRGKKHTVSRPVAHGGSVYIEITEQYKYKIPKDQFKETTVKFIVSGKHKILGRSLSLGKVFIGDTSRDETGVVHWRTVCSSPGLAWTVWHSIYSS